MTNDSASSTPLSVKHSKWAEGMDFILPIGNACRPARQLKTAGLRTFSAPLDWMMRYPLDLAADLIINGFEGFFSCPEEDSVRGKGKNNRYVIDKATGMVSMHGFSWAKSLEEELPAFYEKMLRRGRRLKEKILEADRIGVLMNRNEKEETILAFTRKLSAAFPQQQFYVLNLFDDKSLSDNQRSRRIIAETESYSVCEIRLNDSHEDGVDPKKNPNFWLGNVPAWQKILSQEFSLKQMTSEVPPKVSVIIPCYNVEKYLRKCLDSVVNQTLKEIEIICVDDGSTDSTLQILEEYARADPRIIVLKQKNAGVAAARNHALKHCRGDFIGFVDPDDYVESNMFEELYSATDNGQAEIVECAAYVEDEGHADKNFARDQKKSFIHVDFETRNFSFSHMIQGKFNAVLWTKIYKREFIELNKLTFETRLKRGSDSHFQWTCFPHCRYYRRISKQLYHYVVGRAGSLQSVSDPKKDWESHLLNCRLLFENWETKGWIDTAGSILLLRLWNISKWRYKLCFGETSELLFFMRTKELWILFSDKGKIPEHVLEKLSPPEKQKFLNGFNSSDKKIIVSLTSFPARIKTVHQTIESLLSQTWKADRIVLWLADSQFPKKEQDLPEALLALRERGLEIRWCEDLKSFKKLIPSLKAFPNDAIVTVDDDLILESTWLEELVVSYLMNPQYIHTHRAHEIIFSDKKRLAPYKQWTKEIKTKKLSFNNFLTGVGGCLYPPNCLRKDVFEIEKFQKLCPHGDDIWFWAMAVLAGTKICVTPTVFKLKHPDGTQEVGLWETVNVHGENDKALRRVLEAYPQILPKLDRIYKSSATSTSKQPSRGNPCSSMVPSPAKSPKKLPRFLVRLGALFILNKAARKRWRERHMDLTPKNGIDINMTPELRRDSALKRFAVRTVSLFIFSKSKRKAFRAKYLDLTPRDGVDIAWLSPEERRLRKQKKRERNPFRRLFNELVPASRSKLSHAEKRLTRHMEWQTRQILAAIKASQAQTEQRLDALKQDIDLLRAWISKELSAIREENAKQNAEAREALKTRFTSLTESCARELSDLRDSCSRDLAIVRDELGARVDDVRMTLSAQIEVSEDLREARSLCDKDSTMPPKDTDEGVPIVFATDENYSPQACTAILSVIKTWRGVLPKFVVLTLTQLSEATLERFREIEQVYKCRIDFILIENKVLSTLPLFIKHISGTTYARLLLAEVLPSCKKCLYLDCDVVAADDLSVLCELDMENTYIAGVPAAAYRTQEEANCKRLGLPNLQKYVNAGVLLMNLEKIRKDGLTAKFLKLAATGYSSQDQDVLNVACFPHIKVLSPVFNVMTKYNWGNDARLEICFSPDEIQRAKLHPTLIHYADKIKPWAERNVAWGELWHRYSSFAEELKRQCYRIKKL